MTEDELLTDASNKGAELAEASGNFPTIDRDWDRYFDAFPEATDTDKERYRKAFATAYASAVVAAGPPAGTIAPPRTDMEVLSHNVMRQIESEMEHRGLTRKWMADELGVTPGYVSHLFVGRKRNMTLETLVKMATALGKRVSIKIEDM